LCSFATDVPSITKSIVNHVQTSIARQAYNLDNLGAYQAVGLSVRDDLIVRIPLLPVVTFTILSSQIPRHIILTERCSPFSKYVP
jgi:hypothetical protein